MNNYQIKKEEARQMAIDWQLEFYKDDHYMSECAYWGNYFLKLAKRYGLVKEFRENAII
jgi:hypothetical protein